MIYPWGRVGILYNGLLTEATHSFFFLNILRHIIAFYICFVKWICRI